MDAQEIKQLQELQNAYLSVYEAKKVDQDEDGDNDFADVRIARMIASGVSKEEAIRRVKNKEYNEEFEIDEAEKWIQKAIKKPGALHKQLGVPQGKNIPSKKLTAAAKEGGKLGRRARLAQTLSKFHNEEFEEIDSARSAGTLTPAEKKKLGEQYNLVLSYLLDEGYASNQESAEVIIGNMSESWIESIVESLI